MHLPTTQSRRRGSVLPLVVVCLVALIGMVALAIDLGLMMVARTQCQNAADAAAIVGAHALNGDMSNNNYGAAGPAAVAAAGTNSILSAPIAPGQVTATIGSYSYDATSNSFVINPSSKSAADNWTLARAPVTYTGTTFFGGVFNISPYNVATTATAAHRPRDVVLVNDFSGSMRFDTMLAAPHGGTRVQSMNNEPVYPLFGP